MHFFRILNEAMTALTWLQTGHWLVWDKCCRMQNEQTVKLKLKPVNSCAYHR